MSEKNAEKVVPEEESSGEESAALEESEPAEESSDENDRVDFNERAVIMRPLNAGNFLKSNCMGVNL